MISYKDYTTILECVLLYKKELVNSNLLFLYQNRLTGKYEYVEVIFLAGNFMHLTGVIYQNLKHDEVTNSNDAVNFFRLAINKRLDINKCFYKDDGTTILKLRILTIIMNIKKSARMIGEYNGSKIHINANRMCGTTAATLAFVKNEKCEYYPSSTLCEDIRNLVKQYNTILAIYQKQLNDSKYKIIQYSNKKFNDQDIPISIRNLIEFENN